MSYVVGVNSMQPTAERDAHILEQVPDISLYGPIRGGLVAIFEIIGVF